MGEPAIREAVVKTGDLVEGRYRVIKTLGVGGMGTVFLAEHVLIKRRVALKILHADLARDESVVERFMNEARTAGTLGHPNIVESTDMGFTHDHVPYIVYEYLEGTLLTDEIYRVGGLPVRRAVRIAEQIASALQAAHNTNIVHRDLKSDNIFLTDKDDALDHVKVLDFGVSRFLEAEDSRTRGMVVGTPEFMAPEQISDPEGVDKRADIYALGVMLYEMLTARRPFSNDDDPRQLMHRIVHEPVPPLQRPEVPHALEQIVIEKLLAKDRRDRFQTMADVQAALEQFTTGGIAKVRRRSAPIIVPNETFDDQPQTSIRLPKPSHVRHTPVPARDTPWPVATIDTSAAISNVSLPQAPSRRPYALYGIAGAGILIGTIGLVVGMRGGDERHAKQPIAEIAPAPMPAAATATPPKAEKVEVRLDADVANAHIVFRRRINEAPTIMEIAPTDVVELVEVSAPGYKTTRYWLTFDRPTYLKAHLVKGSGTTEASEEDTLAALGEVIMVSGNAPAATAAAEPKREPAAAKVAEKVAEKPASKPAAVVPATSVASNAAMTPRKIGKGSADEKAIETKEEPKNVAVKEEPKAAEPAPVKIEEPKIDVPKPADVAAPEVPSIDKATVSSVISSHRPEVIKCFAEGKKKNPAMKGTLNLQLQVDAGGTIHRVQVQSTLNNPLVAACVVKAANAWKFPTRAGGDVANVSYPFTVN